MQIVQADLSRQDHQRDVLAMTSMYALDAMGNHAPLPSDVLQRLIHGLQKHPTTMIFLAYAEDAVVGIATCFLGFSTFAAKAKVSPGRFLTRLPPRAKKSTA